MIAGICGMNFEVMPERYGYAFALAAMALTGGGLWWYFKSKGWLE